MNPYEKERFELDNGKVAPDENRLIILLAPMGIIPIDGYYDFLKEIPWARVDN